MSFAPGSLALFLPLVTKLFRGPGKLLIALNGTMAVILALISWNAYQDGHGAGMVFFVAALLFLVAIIVFALRGYQLIKRVDEAGAARQRTLGVSTDVEIVDGATPAETEMENLKRRLQDARIEADTTTARFLPRIVAAQRAGIAASGGIVNAPYLKADLRPTIIAGSISLAAGPITLFLLLLAAIIF